MNLLFIKITVFHKTHVISYASSIRLPSVFHVFHENTGVVGQPARWPSRRSAIWPDCGLAAWMPAARLIGKLATPAAADAAGSGNWRRSPPLRKWINICLGLV